jgi:hypothetical protein
LVISTLFTFDDQAPVIAEITFDNGSSMKIKAEQAQANGKLVSFRFLEIDVEYMTRLCNIIIFNLGVDAACERVLI